MPMEVKLNIRKPVIPLGLRSFIKKYSPQSAFVINLLLEQTTKIEETKINFVYPFEVKKILQKET